MPEFPERFEIGGLQNSVMGADLASGATIAPSALIHNVTGAAAVVNITPPWPAFAGVVYLIAAGIFTWTAAGNIAVAGTSTAVGRAVGFVYNPVIGKWYPLTVA
jgi:hypothetical protein